MSFDINKVVRDNLAEAAQRRANRSLVANGLVTDDTMQKTGQAEEGVNDLSMEMLSNAMEKEAIKRQDNDFISSNGKAFKVFENEKDKAVDPAITQAQEKISAISANAEVALDRRSEVAKSLKTYQNNPFVT